MRIKVREKLTLNNLKVIVANKLKTRRGEIKLMIDDNEMTGHMRLMDAGLEDESVLEVKADNVQYQTEEMKGMMEVRSWEE